MKIIPSLIDLHVHFREPGFEYKETIETGVLAARAGGFSGVCTMPNTHPVTDNPETIKYILNKAKEFDFKIYPIAAITKNLNTLELTDFKALKEAGAIGFSNDGLPLLDKEVFFEALKTGELILSHCEEETAEIKWQIELFKRAVERGFSPKLHFCHVSKKDSLKLIRKAKKEGLKITAETAPHYFTLSKNDVTQNGVFKMNPPLGSLEDKKAVIEAVYDGTIDAIATDHAPHSIEEKLKPYKEALNGITGLETAFSLTYMAFGLEVAIEKMAAAPRRILGIEDNSTIKVDLDKTWTVCAKDFKTKCKISPYEGMELRGRVV